MPRSVIYGQAVDGSSFSVASLSIDDRAHRPVLCQQRAAAQRRGSALLDAAVCRMANLHDVVTGDGSAIDAESVIYGQVVDRSSFSFAGVTIDDRVRGPRRCQHRATTQRRVPG